MTMIMLALICLSGGPEGYPAGSWSEEARAFSAGPVAPSLDLRQMLTRRMVARSCALLDETAARRRTAIASGKWQAWREDVRAAVLESLGPIPLGASGGPLNIREVSRHERPGYVVENVLFESLPGMDVNASVYLPLSETFPPPWPAVVVPVGHSAKTRESYQKPAQVFARMGYVAVTFDPPGMAGEKGPGNDHFTDGARCYLVGHSSNRYFVLDALRCIDYLATRPDVDMSRGVGMTGVSGGGVTTMFATVLDDRIRASGPSCCAVSKALHPVLDVYAECPEVLPFARFQHYDDADLIAAAPPAAVLLMAGAKDEVFTEAMSRQLAEELRASFDAAGHAERFDFFLDPGGHAYTPAMALAFVRWMDRWLRGTDRILPEVREEDLEMLPDEMLACHPRTDRNMFTVTRDEALALRGRRSGLPVIEAARLIAGVPDTVTLPEARSGQAVLAWFHAVREVMLCPEPGIELPGVFMCPARQDWRGAALLYFDDRGRWTDLRSHGALARVTGFIDEKTDGPAVFSVDLRGWGDSRPADLPYDIAGWGSRDRWIAYVSAGMGDAVMAMRIRDGLSALAWLRARENIDPVRIIVGGRGLGGIVALHVAAIDGTLAGAFSVDGPASLEEVVAAESYAWPPEIFVPRLLQHYDLPELVAGLPMPVLIATPRDAQRRPLNPEAMETRYAVASDEKESFQLSADPDAFVAFTRKYARQ